MNVVMVGPFPPPTHGMSVINCAMYHVLQTSCGSVERIDTSGPNLARSVFARLRRLPRIILSAARLGRSQAPTLYMSVSGGFGQVYEVVFLLLARMKGMRVFLHHHCFAYLDRPNFVTQTLLRLAEGRAVHITLSDGMAARLGSLGVCRSRIVSLSNAAFLASPSEVPIVIRDSLRTIGFLGNISEEKGIFEFIALAEAMNILAPNLRFVLAGPFQDFTVEADVRNRLAKSPIVEYVGPKYGASKSRFFTEIDALVFPTKYANEAEPVTIHEAMMHAVPVIAIGRGAIPEMMRNGGGLVIPVASDFLDAALQQLCEWDRSNSAYLDASSAAAAVYCEANLCSRNKLVDLVTDILK